jgi:hypothetical protein
MRQGKGGKVGGREGGGCVSVGVAAREVGEGGGRSEKRGRGSGLGRLRGSRGMKILRMRLRGCVLGRWTPMLGRGVEWRGMTGDVI